MTQQQKSSTENKNFAGEKRKGIPIATNPIAQTGARKGNLLMYYNMAFIFEALHISSIPLFKMDVTRHDT